MNDVWTENGTAVHKWPAVGEDFVDLWDKLSANLRIVKVEEMAVILGGIWHRRNKVVFDNLFDSTSQVINISLAIHKEYKEEQEKKDDMMRREVQITELGRNL